jgi:hypothetical protein
MQISWITVVDAKKKRAAAHTLDSSLTGCPKRPSKFLIHKLLKISAQVSRTEKALWQNETHRMNTPWHHKRRVDEELISTEWGSADLNTKGQAGIRTGTETFRHSRLSRRITNYN